MTTFFVHCRLSCALAFLSLAVLSPSACKVLRAQPAAPVADEEQVFQPGDDQGAQATPPAQMKQFAVVAATNYDDLISDINFIGSMVGQPNIAAMVEGAVANMTGGKGLAGVDKTKPWGLIVQTDGAQFLPVVCLPVIDAEQVLAAVANVGEIQDDPSGVKRVAMPDGNAIFMKSEGGWAYLARNVASLSRLPKGPEAAFTKLLADSDFAARASVQNAPPMYRQLAILTIQSAMNQQLQRQAGESDDEYAVRRKSVQTQMQQAVQQIKDIDTLGFGWLVDQPQKRSVIEFDYSFVPGSQMAQQLGAYDQPKTNFAGFYQPDAAATARFASQADPNADQKDLAQFQAQFDTMMSGARAQFNKAVDESDNIPDQTTREAIKAAGGDWFDAFEATMKAGVMDGAAALRVSPDSLTFVAGTTVAEPTKIESGLKKLEEGHKQAPDAPKVQWNAASHGGVNFHTLSVPLHGEHEGAAKLLGGKADVSVGIGKDAVYLAVGKDNLAAVQKAMDASKAEPNKAVPPFELNVALLPIMETLSAQATNSSDRSQAVVDMLRQQAAGRDHVRMIGQVIPNGLKYRIEAEEGALRAIGAAAATHQQQAATGE